MSSVTVVNAANVYAKNFLRFMKSFDRNVILGDIYNSRTSFLHFLHNQRRFENREFRHMNISNKLLLEEAIRPSKTVVFFTHDYLSMVMDKNQQIRYTADICKTYGVEKLVCVCPIELDNYYTAGGVVADPIKEFNEARDYVMQTFPKTVFLRTNMIYGSESYFIRFIIQNWMNSTEVFDAEKYKTFRFNPLYYDDLNEIVNLALTDETLEGRKLILNGKDNVSFLDINNLIRQSKFAEDNYIYLYKDRKRLVHRALQLFFHGNNHFVNMEAFLDYYNNNSVNFNDYDNIVEKLKLETQNNFKSYYLEKKNENTDYLDPVFFSYYNTSLN